MSSIQNYIDLNKDRFVSELFDFLRIPSVGCLESCNEDTLKAAEFLKNKFIEGGADTSYLIPTEGHPLVYAEKIVSESLPTVLFYGHYDVQPADPYNLWVTDPFSPTIRDGRIYARGSSDDKGQVYLNVKAFESLVATNTLPCNIKFIIEGEEEQGSEGFINFLKTGEGKELLKADVILVSDTAMIADDTPSINIGLRGIITFDIEVSGPNVDLHSGLYGGAVPNPIHELCNIISKLRDTNNKILIPNFYKDVVEIDEGDKRLINYKEFDLIQFKKSIGINDVLGENGYTTLERIGVRPSLELNGISGGYCGEGFKTIIPSSASAKVSARLVPNQDPEEIAIEMESYLKGIVNKSFNLKFTVNGKGTRALVVDSKSAAINAARNAMLKVWGKQPVLTKDGGSIPVLSHLTLLLNADVIMLGVGSPLDAIHSPNESLRLDSFFKGIDLIVNFYSFISKGDV